MQRVIVEAGFSFDRAIEIILDLVHDGFDIVAGYSNGSWSIRAAKTTDDSEKVNMDKFLNGGID